MPSKNNKAVGAPKKQQNKAPKVQQKEEKKGKAAGVKRVNDSDAAPSNKRARGEVAAPVEEKEVQVEEVKVEEGKNVHLTNKPFPADLRCSSQIAKQWKYMSHVQELALPPLLEGKDVQAQAKTGSGKTLAFLIPAIEIAMRPANINSGEVIAMILVPVRELCDQICAVAGSLLGANRNEVAVHKITGVTPPKKMQAIFASNKKHIIVASPGRFTQFIKDEGIKFNGIKLFILDEADTLLDMGFYKHISDISKTLAPGHQRALFSATITPRVEEVGELKPNRVVVNTVIKGQSHANVHVTQEYTVVQPKELLGTLMTILNDFQDKKEHSLIVFTETASTAAFLQTYAEANGIKKTMLFTGRVEAKRRSSTFESFKKDGGIIFASDLASRGLDFPKVTRIVQVGVPSTADIYVHRIGRTGRMGKKGHALSILFPFQTKMIDVVQTSRNMRIKEVKLEQTPCKTVKSLFSMVALCNAYCKFICFCASTKFCRDAFTTYLDQLEAVGKDLFCVPTTRIITPHTASRGSMSKDLAKPFLVKEEEKHLIAAYLDKKEKNAIEYTKFKQIAKAKREGKATKGN